MLSIPYVRSNNARKSRLILLMFQAYLYGVPVRIMYEYGRMMPARVSVLSGLFCISCVSFVFRGTHVRTRNVVPVNNGDGFARTDRVYASAECTLRCYTELSNNFHVRYVVRRTRFRSATIILHAIAVRERQSVIPRGEFHVPSWLWMNRSVSCLRACYNLKIILYSPLEKCFVKTNDGEKVKYYNTVRNSVWIFLFWSKKSKTNAVVL